MSLLQATDRLPGDSTVAAIGMFDGVHLGHVTLVDFLKQQATATGRQSLIVTFEQHPQTVLAPQHTCPLIVSSQERLQLLEQLSPDWVVALDFTQALASLTAAQFMELLRERYGVARLVVGYNHHFGSDGPKSLADYQAIGQQVGLSVVQAPEYLGPYAPVSSTIIRRLIAAGKVDDALHCMGRPFALEGRVVHGFGNGASLGFPTANVDEIAPDLVMPHQGAYAVMAKVGSHTLQGMANIGHRPTLNNGNNVSVEVNLFDFDSDIYGQPIRLEFIHFLRLEHKMCSLEELKHQLANDRERARAALQAYIHSTISPNTSTNNGNHQSM